MEDNGYLTVQNPYSTKPFRVVEGWTCNVALWHVHYTCTLQSVIFCVTLVMPDLVYKGKALSCIWWFQTKSLWTRISSTGNLWYTCCPWPDFLIFVISCSAVNWDVTVILCKMKKKIIYKVNVSCWIYNAWHIKSIGCGYKTNNHIQKLLNKQTSVK